MITIPLYPEQYQAAITHLLQAKPPDVYMFQLPTVNNPGQIVNSQVTLSFTYNGSNALSVNILQKHGLARFASESTIQAHLVDLLTKLGA